MIPTFRYNLLSIEKFEIKKDEKKGIEENDQMFARLVEMFANLELSEKTEYEMRNWCTAFKQLDDNGKMSPTDHMLQKDAFEFMTNFFEQLQNRIDGTSRERLIKDTFGFKLCQTKVCRNCRRVRNRVTNETFLPVVVTGLDNLEDSLKKMIEPEIIEGAEC